MAKRIPQVNELIQRELSQIILREIDFSSDILVTITRVATSQDLEHAKIYISVIPEKKRKDTLQILNSQIYSLQGLLNRRLNIQPCPRICFMEEKETVKADEIEKILEELKKNKK